MMAVALALVGSLFAATPAVSGPIDALGSVYTLTTSAGSQGAAFAVSKTELVTAAHVVEGADRVRLEGTQTPPVRRNAVVVFRDEDNDIAILQLNAPVSGETGPLDWREGAVQAGLQVFALGSPIDGVVLSTGQVLGIDEDGLILSSTPVDPGNSGGPLLDATGAVAGVVIAKSELSGDAYAVPADIARQALSDARRAPVEAVPLRPSEPASSPSGFVAAWIALGLSLIALALAIASLFVSLVRRPRMHAPPINITLD